MATLLEVQNLKTQFVTRSGVVRAVDDVSWDVGESETVALVGESGCGKSVSALSIMRLVAGPSGQIVGGQVLFKGRDLLRLSEEEMRHVEKKNQERQETLEKGWRQREAELKAREEELTHLRKEVEGFPARLQNDAETAALRVRRETEAKFEQEVLVLKKDAETEKRLAELHVRTLEETLARQAAQIVTLEKQLVEAKQQVQDIAVKAIEGASGSKALSHVNQIAMEQAKNRPQG